MAYTTHAQRNNADAVVALLNQVITNQGGNRSYGAGLPSSTPTSLYIHGPGGLFSTPGLERSVFSAFSLPNTGLAARLPVVDSNVADPLRQLITGIGTASGSEPVGVCDDPPTAGFLYGCSTLFPFGRVARQTRVFDVDRLTLQARGERFDFQVVGGQSPRSNLTPSVASTPQQILQNEMTSQMFSMAVEFLRVLGRMTYNGNPANNTAGGGYKEFLGLQSLVKTGYTDALVPATSCNALDSYTQTIAADIAGAAATVVQAFTNAWRYVRRRADLSGLNPVQWAFTMRPELFYQITEFWPCAYATYRCNTIFTDPADIRQVDGMRISEMRDAMRNGSYLLIDGVQVEVIQDDALPETEVVANTTYSSDAYLVPLTVAGGTLATYYQAMNYNAAVMQALALASNGAYYTTDGGRFLWVRKPVNNFCIQSIAKIEPRLILETPHLAARLIDLRYSPTFRLPTAYPGEDGYLNGGVQTR